MTKTFCDCCENHIEGIHKYPVAIFRHVPNENPMNGHGTMINGRMEPTSGVQNNYDLCLVCYNALIYPLWDAFKKRKENSQPIKRKD